MDLVKESKLPCDIIDKLENRASFYWDEFYRRNRDGFFKARHWFEQEFEHELKDACNILEAGCGTGSSVYPLLSIRDDSHVYACDFAPSAIELVQRNPKYASGRVTGFAADLTKDALEKTIPIESVDTCLMIFVLSAIKPADMVAALGNVNRVVKQGGIVCFRDYCSGDLAQIRMGQIGKQQMMEENFFARGDGTLAYYFDEVTLDTIFQQAHFEKVYCNIIARTEVNRRSGVNRNRKYIQAVYRKKHTIFPGELEVLRGASSDPINPSLASTSQDTSVRVEKIGAISALLDSSKDDQTTRDLSTFLCTHADICLNAFTIDISLHLQCCGRLALAALNFSSAHLTIASSDNIVQLRNTYNSNSIQYLYERLRIVAEPVWNDIMATSALQFATRPDRCNKKVILVSIAEAECGLGRELRIISDIAFMDTVQTYVYLACPASKAHFVCKQVTRFFSTGIGMAIEQLPSPNLRNHTKIFIWELNLSG